MEPSPEPKRVSSAGSRRAHLDKVFGTTEAAPARRLRSAVGRQLFEYVLEKPSGTETASRGRILIVDHDRLSREILARNLQREGYGVEFEEEGTRALERLREGNFDLALWEVELPGLSGLEMLKRARNDAVLLHIPVVLLSEVKDAETVIRCIEAGADDYLPKPFNPALLKARIRASMERKNLRDQEQRLLGRIKAYQERISGELADATTYLMSLLPERLREPFTTDWRFIPSSELGGDTFGYHWIDEDHFALYLLDVCGHGVGAALLSVTALNVIRSHALSGADFRNPSEVLRAANQVFPMERQNNRYFTLWYGVYRRSTRTLTYGSGGHPPALLFEPGAAAPKKLAARGMMVGGMPNSRYTSQACEIAAGSRLFLFCDGVYEITLPEGRMYTLDEFAGLLGKLPADAPVDLDAVVAQIYELRGSRELEDDLSLIAIQF
ncbi:MAG TPA: SpoIIE family protein phosphatase [Candidatus Methylacidiphilales bacterium]|jgi:sigma-B regulation protein RsbU (phosphoserine phosphatase)|nr:SpoIIE family protein phosphatase [Candidatus Methylacidiphilales bacterium]